MSLKNMPSFRSPLSFFCALLSLSSIIVLSLYDSYNTRNNVLLPHTSLQIFEIVQAASPISKPASYYCITCNLVFVV